MMRHLAMGVMVGLCALASESAEFISVPGAPELLPDYPTTQRSAVGTSWFARDFEVKKPVARAVWSVTGLGVFEVYVNGERVGNDFLKPGFTHPEKTRRVFEYDVTKLLQPGTNTLVAEVSSGWWRDQVMGWRGKESAFWGKLLLTYEDGWYDVVETDTENWRGAIAGPVKAAGIFDGETYDARVAAPVKGDAGWKPVVRNEEFKGALLKTDGAEVTLRRDLAIKRGPYDLKKGETLVVDFGQNCSAVPEFRFAAKAGTTLTALPGEMLNDADKGERGCDGPKGSVYRTNLRTAETCMRLEYTFAGTGVEEYLPRFTFFGYRYLSITATDDVKIESVTTVPVTSITKAMEIGRIETGDESVNRLIANVYWGQLSNYLSVPTDCPQRNERQGWTADTQVFTEAGAFNADTYDFMRKFMQDVRDTQMPSGSYTGVAPLAEYGIAREACLGWADCGIIVPYVMWRQFGRTEGLYEHWESMTKFMDWLELNRYAKGLSTEFQWGDWLSYEAFESSGDGAWVKDAEGKKTEKPLAEAALYWKYLGACYWLMDARMMAEMAQGLGKYAEARKYRGMSGKALAYLLTDILEDGKIPKCLRGMQTPAVFALHLRILGERDAAETKAALLANIKAHGDCLQTGFLGTSILMDTLTEIGASDVAYTLLLQHKCPSWLYSVDQGATTIWERWNSYTKQDGFGDAGMNSFNHYAYGAVLAWIYKTAAGIAADAKAPGFKNIIMAPKPDKRLGHVTAEYRSAAGLIKSAWRYEGEEWIWDFTVPAGATASVTLPGETAAKTYTAGTYRIER